MESVVGDFRDSVASLDDGVGAWVIITSCVVSGTGWGFLSRLPCFRPARLVARYSHFLPLLVQREHVGFSVLHFTLEAAQAWQLLRSLGVGASGAGERGPG